MRYLKYQKLSAIVMALLVWNIASAQQQPNIRQPNSKSAEQCTLTLSQAPELRGFRLGMDVQQLTTQFPEIKINPADEFGFNEITLEFNPGPVYGGYDVLMEGKVSASINRMKFQGFDGVKYIEIKALDGHIFFLKIRYDDTVKWNDIDEYVKQISSSLNLPGAWHYVPGAGEAGSSTITRTLNCASFRITAGVGNMGGGIPGIGGEYSTLALEDLNAESLLAKRKTDAELKRQSEEEQRRKTFKP
jgi:hypothetical protein